MISLPLFTLAAASGDRYTYLQPGGVAFNLTALIIGLLIGGLLACIATVFHNRGVLRFIKAIRSARAESRESSRTLEELGLRLTPSLRHSLRARSSLIRKLVSVVLPDGTVLDPIHSKDDDLAKESGLTPDADSAKEAAPIPTDVDPSATIFDPTTATYFLDDVHRRRAELRFDKRGNDMRFLIPATAAFVALIVALPVYMPYAVEALDALLQMIFG